MKVLILFRSDTGNTRKIAYAMAEAIKDLCEVCDLSSIDTFDVSQLNNYDLLVLGSAIEGGVPYDSIEALINKSAKIPPKVALFFTHLYKAEESLRYLPDLKFELKKKGCMVISEFECYGSLNLSSEIFAKMTAPLDQNTKDKLIKQIEIARGHPNLTDLENAKNFAMRLVT